VEVKRDTIIVPFASDTDISRRGEFLRSRRTNSPFRAPRRRNATCSCRNPRYIFRPPKGGRDVSRLSPTWMNSAKPQNCIDGFKTVSGSALGNQRQEFPHDKRFSLCGA